MAVDLERKRARARKWHYANREKVLARQHLYYQTNRTDILDYVKRWRAANIDAIRERERVYKIAYRAKKRAERISMSEPLSSDNRA